MTIFHSDYFVTCEPLCRVPQDINPDPSAKSAPVGNESPKVDKSPSPQGEKTKAESPKPPRPKGARGSFGASGALHSPTCAASTIILWVLPQARSRPSPPRPLPRAPGPMDSGLPMGINLAKARPCPSLRSCRDSIQGLQSLCGTTQSLSKLDSTSGSSSQWSSIPMLTRRTSRHSTPIWSPPRVELM
jgi:hypothetical protein